MDNSAPKSTLTFDRNLTSDLQLALQLNFHSEVGSGVAGADIYEVSGNFIPLAFSEVGPIVMISRSLLPNIRILSLQSYAFDNVKNRQADSPITYVENPYYVSTLRRKNSKSGILIFSDTFLDSQNLGFIFEVGSKWNSLQSPYITGSERDIFGAMLDYKSISPSMNFFLEQGRSVDEYKR